MESRKISLDLIRIDCGTQMRIDKNNHVVDEYAERLADGVEFPQVTVFTDGTEYWLADGFHRYFAHQKAGLDTIACEVRQGTLNDALDFACRANQSHGLQRTNADKRRAVEEYFKIPGNEALTNSEVGKRLGLSTPFVKNVRDKLGIKASPASHMGAGSTKRQQPLNGLIKPVSEKASSNGSNKSTPKKPGKTITVELPDNDEHDFAVRLLRHFDPKYLKSCSEYFGNFL